MRRFQIIHGAIEEALPSLAGPFDACLCDPPYHLTAGKRGGSGAASENLSSPAGRSRATTGFMGKAWDGGDVAFRPETWAAVLRRLRPGAMLLAFGGPRTFHRLACAIEDGGFEIRDVLCWLYGSGFPKSRDIPKAIDKAAGVVGSFGAPKSAAHAGWIERGRMRGEEGHEGFQRPWMGDPQAVERNALRYIPATPDAARFAGYGTALKPAWEPIILAMAPLAGTYAANALEHGVAGLNVDGCRIATADNLNGGAYAASGQRSDLPGADRSAKAAGMMASGKTANAGYVQPSGRWPANVVLDEFDDPVLRLRGNVIEEVARIIRLYFGEVPDVREGRADVPKQEEAKKVLQQGVLREGPDEADRKEVAAARGAAHCRGEGQDVGGEESGGDQRAEVSDMDGREAHQPRLRHGQRRAAVAGRADHVRADAESVKRGVCAGAPPGNGAEAGPATAALRGGSPPQRRQGGQPPAEFRADGQRNTQEGTRSNTPRAATTSARERGIEVRASQVPPGWLSYFEPTGRSVRSGSAARLDGQTGRQVSGVAVNRNRRGAKRSTVNNAPEDKTGQPDAGYGDTGGASRFFYTAKADAAERAIGGTRCDHPTLKPIDLCAWLAKLILPPPRADGQPRRLLVPFSGAGSEVIGALRAGWDEVVGVEREAEYVEQSRRRIAGDAPLLNAEGG